MSIAATITLPAKIAGALAIILLVHIAGAAFTGAEEKKTDPPKVTKTDLPKGPKVNEIIITGKFSCSLKRQVTLPFKGTITAVLAQAGKKVKVGETLARYQLAPESRFEIQRRLSPPEIKDLEMRLAGLEKEKAELETKRREVKQLAEQNLSSPQTSITINREINTLSKQQHSGKERLQQLQNLTKADLVYLKDQLGKFIESGQVPQEAAIISPLNGYVLWVQPELREGAELGPGTRAFIVGVLDPIIVMADVHELEAMQLALGDKAEVTVDSLPDRKFTAQVSRLSLTPIDPKTEQPSYYQIEFTVANRDLELKDGLKARITIRK